MDNRGTKMKYLTLKYIHSHVYIVLEIPTEADEEPKIHGVYANREHADNHVVKLFTRHKRKGYIAVLKQKVRGN